MAHSPSFKKRFWTEASVIPVEQGFAIELDGRPVHTPAKTPVRVPTQALAEIIAAEWQAQDGAVNPETMPATKMANAAIDLVAPQFDAVAKMLAEYGGSDLICYRAEQPQELVLRQAEAWDPLIDWAVQNFGAPLTVTTGVLPVDQPGTSLQRLSDQVFAQDAFALSALHDLVALSGSLVIGLAAAANHLPVQQAWAASRIDETWQAEQWGVDDGAAKAAAIKQQEFSFAHTFLMALR